MNSKIFPIALILIFTLIQFSCCRELTLNEIRTGKYICQNSYSSYCKFCNPQYTSSKSIDTVEIFFEDNKLNLSNYLLEGITSDSFVYSLDPKIFLKAKFIPFDSFEFSKYQISLGNSSSLDSKCKFLKR